MTHVVIHCYSFTASWRMLHLYPNLLPYNASSFQPFKLSHAYTTSLAVCVRELSERQLPGYGDDDIRMIAETTSYLRGQCLENAGSDSNLEAES